MARKKKPGLIGWALILTNAAEQIQHQRYVNQREAIRLQRDREALALDKIKKRHAALKFRKDRETTRGIILKNESTSLDNDLKAARIKETQERTKGLEISNKLNSYKLNALDPSLAPGGTKAYECPVCGDFYTNPTPNAPLICSNILCNNAPLVQTVLNLN